MNLKRLFAIILCVALVMTSCAACKNNEEEPEPKATEVSSNVPADNQTAEPTQEPADNPTDEPTQEPEDKPTEEPTSKPTEKPADGSVNLEDLIEDYFGTADVTDSSITIDVTSSYGDIAYFSLENSENFTVSFRISEFLPTENHQQVGIIIAPNVTNLSVYGKFMRTFSGSNLIESYGTDGTSWDTPDGSGQTPDAFTSSDSIYMKVVRNGAQIGFYVSADGAEWTELHQYDCKFEDDLQIGFTGATFTAAEAHAVIDNVKVIYG